VLNSTHDLPIVSAGCCHLPHVQNLLVVKQDDQFNKATQHPPYLLRSQQPAPGVAISRMDFLKSAVASAIAKGPPFPYNFGDKVDIDQSIWTLNNGTRRVRRPSQTL
jgi:hypothetical protein